MTKTSTTLVSWKERISYGLSDTASNLTFQMVTFFLMFYYTDIIGIDPVALVTLFLVARIWDGVNDPLMGIIVDKTSTKWGKSRPYFLWMAVPYALFAILTFTDFGLTGSNQLLYAYVTYIGFGMIYTAINIPITAILPSMTDNYQERTDIAAIRMIFAVVGGLIVASATMPLVELLGKGDDSIGFRNTMIVFSLIAIVLFILAFINVRERIITKSSEKALKISESIQAVKGNWPWLIITFLGIFFWIGNAMKNASTIYFLEYYFGRIDLAPIIIPLGLISMLIAVSVVPIITRKISKKNTILVGGAIAIIGYLLLIIAGRYHIGLLFIGTFLSNFGGGFGAGVIFSMIADSVDYGEWKSGVRAQGLLCAAGGFGAKVGMGIGAALASFILAKGGYIAGAVQSENALLAIQMNYILVPMATTIIACLLLVFYRLDNQYDEIIKELHNRRGQMAT